jgi:hypothetical protein
VERTTGNLDTARVAYERAFRELESLVSANPYAANYRYSMAATLYNLSRLEGTTGNSVAAREALERSIEICEFVVSANPSVPAYREGLAKSLSTRPTN